MYTKQQFGKELKQKIQRKESIALIGRWAHNLYYEHMSEIDVTDGFRRFLIQLGTMEMGREFERSHEELNRIADKLIAGEDVTL